jgi:hypothetical protein
MFLQTILPTANALTAYSVPVTFPSSGTYTVRFTEVGPDDSFGAIVDNIALMVCFAGGTRITTPDGVVCIQDLTVGDLVSTMNGAKVLRWIGCRTVTASELKDNSKFWPVRITTGALGRGLPTADLRVSRQHRMLANSPVAKRMFGSDSVLVSAIRLTELPGIFVESDAEDVTYFHLLFDAHEIVFANEAPS